VIHGEDLLVDLMAYGGATRSSHDLMLSKRPLIRKIRDNLPRLRVDNVWLPICT
jgi:hypothetical protein